MTRRGAEVKNQSQKHSCHRRKVTRLFALPPPATNAAPQEVTYHGVKTVFPGIVLAANEGRSYVDAVDVRSGAGSWTALPKACCVERIPSEAGATVRALISNIEDGTLQLVEVSADGKMRPIAKAHLYCGINW